jgi:hypothetical protein
MIDKNLLFSLLKIQSHSGECDDMQNFIIDYVLDKGYNIDLDDFGNIYVIKGTADTYPCVVAHLDTVHRITPHGIEVAEFVGNTDIIFGMNPATHRLTGIGGDDKCGIYAALYCLEHLDACKVALFVDEEVGCVGSSQANISFFKDCRFILQADRRGNSDFVKSISGPLSSDTFLKDVKPIISRYGYSFSSGAMTDVEALRDGKVGLSVANMSAGYYNPHTDSEYINLYDLNNVCEMMLDIFLTMTDVYPFEFTKPPYKVHRLSYKDWKRGWKPWGTDSNEVIHPPFYDMNVEEEAPDDDDDDTILIGNRLRKISEMTEEEWLEFDRDEPENSLA